MGNLVRYFHTVGINTAGLKLVKEISNLLMGKWASVELHSTITYYIILCNYIGQK